MDLTNIKFKKFNNWSKTLTSNSAKFFPINNHELIQIIKYAKLSKIKITLESSNQNYNDQTLNENGLIISFKKMNKILNFEEKNKLITVEPGCKLSKLLNFTLNKNLSIGSIPGSSNISIVGAFVNNVHGKDSSFHTSFINNISKISILDNNYRIQELDLNDIPKIMTFGLVFFVVSITLKLQSIEGQSVLNKKIFFNNYKDILNIFNNNNNKYIYGWIDAHSKLKRGFIEIGEINNLSLTKSININFFLKFFLKININLLVNKYTIKILNSSLYFLLKTFNKPKNIPIYDFYFPLEKFNHNKYFKNGLIELQLFIYEKNCLQILKKIFEICEKYDCQSYLMGIKKHSKDSFKFSFYDSGYSISIDLPGSYKKNAKFKFFIEEINDLALKKFIKVNIYKDIFLSEENFNKIYKSEIIDFLKIKNKYDPNYLISSDFSKRLLKI